MSASENAQEQTEDRERMVAKWMIKGQAKRGKPIITSKSFLGKVGENPTSFLENLVIDAEANGWDETNLFEVIRDFSRMMLGNGISITDIGCDTGMKVQTKGIALYQSS